MDFKEILEHHILDHRIASLFAFNGVNFSFTKHLFMMWLASAFLILLFSLLMRGTSGFARRLRLAVEAIALYVRDEIVVPPDVTDGLATLYALRARSFNAGDKLTVPVMDNGTLYSVNIEATGPEHLRMRVGEFDAWNLRITILDQKKQQVGKNISVMMSRDERRLPLRIQADLPVGYFVLALKEVR